MNKLRKIIQKSGFDLHKFRPEVERMAWTKNLNIKTVIDVGGNVGQFATEIRNILPEVFIYSFEPIKECFDRLNLNLSKDKKFKSFNFALGKNNEEVVMNKNIYSPSSSILDMADAHKNFFPHTKISTSEKILVKNFDSLDLHMEKNILLKIDTQGYEKNVLEGMTETLKNISAIIIETSFLELYKNQPVFDDIYEFLKEKEFQYKGAVQQKLNKDTGEVISEDSVFIKK